jgi:hypothetical protein
VTVGYVAKWMPLLEAIQHVQRIVGGPLKDARDKLLIALREGAVTARYRGKDIGGVAAHYEGTGGGVPPTRWYKAATLFDDGSVEFSDNPYFPFPRPIDLREQIEIQRSALLRWWPARPEPITEQPAQRRRGASKTAPPPGRAPALKGAPITSEHGYGLQAEVPGRGGRRGRKPGSGSHNDDNALMHMLRLLANSEARSVHAAAKIASYNHQKGHSRDADISRLRTKFAKKFGVEPPPGKTWAVVEDELKKN